MELDFRDFDLGECGDSYGSFLWFNWDGREEVRCIYDGGSSNWVESGEDDNVQCVVLNIDWFSDEVLLEVAKKYLI